MNSQTSHDTFSPAAPAPLSGSLPGDRARAGVHSSMENLRGDLNDLLLQIEDPRYPEAAEQIGKPSGIITAEDLLSTNTPEPAQIIRGVLRAGQVGLIAAPPKAGKTWLLQNLALAVSTGGMWLAWRTTPGRVLLVDPELPGCPASFQSAAPCRRKSCGRIFFDSCPNRRPLGQFSHGTP